MDKIEAQEQLAYIKQIIEDTKKTAIDSGWGYISWGIAMILAAGITQLLVLFQLVQYNWLVWVVFIIGMWMATFIVERRLERRRRISTFSQKILRYIWTGFGVSAMLLGFVGILADVYAKGSYSMGIISIVLGSAYFVTGGIYEWHYLKMVGLAWWGGGSVMLFFPQYALVLFSLLMLFAQVIPGLIIRSRYKKSLNTTVPAGEPNV